MKEYDFNESEVVSELLGMARREIEELGRITPSTYVQLLNNDVSPDLLDAIEEGLVDELQDCDHYEEFYNYEN